MDLTQIIIALATLLCSLVAGFLLAFSLVVMPGIKTMNDHIFLKSFKVMDHVIQTNQPGFILIWGGSVLAIIASIAVGIMRLEGVELMLTLLAAVVYLLGVQLPTMTINVPLNNQLQKTNLDALSDSELAEARTRFEPRWIRWNTIRTYVSVLTTVLLLAVAFRL